MQYFQEYKIKKQATYSHINFYNLMSVAPKLLKCRVNTTYFVKNHGIISKYFEA